MSGQEDNQADIDTVKELNGLEKDEQVEVIADHYAAVTCMSQYTMLTLKNIWKNIPLKSHLI